MLDITIRSCDNGYIISDHLTAKRYIATKIDSYMLDNHTIASILRTIEEESKPDTNATTEAE